MSHLLYHLSIVVLSAGTVLCLPLLIRFFGRSLLAYWVFVQSEKVFLIGTEIVFALLLIGISNHVRRSWHATRVAKMAETAGMVYAFAGPRPAIERRIRKLKESHGTARDVMVIGSTGARTFAAPVGELHTVLRQCRRARVMLLNPLGDGATARANSILAPEVTPERLGDQIRSSIAFLKDLKTAQREVRLKLYEEPPLLKLAILGDYAWVTQYRPGLDAQEAMPEYVFEHDQSPGSLYTAFYEYFRRRWESADAAEYDFETDELVYRDRSGRELRRVPFGEPGCRAASHPASLARGQDPSGPRASHFGSGSARG